MSNDASSSRSERIVRKIGIFLLALSLPVVLFGALFQMLLHAIFPNAMRLRSEKRRRLRERMREWQKTQLDIYRSKSYEQLRLLPPRTSLAAPLEFKGRRFYLARAKGDQGGVEISVRAEERVFLIFFTVDAPSFEMLESGQIVIPPDHDPDD